MSTPEVSVANLVKLAEKFRKAQRRTKLAKRAWGIAERAEKRVADEYLAALPRNITADPA